MRRSYHAIFESYSSPHTAPGRISARNDAAAARLLEQCARARLDELHEGSAAAAALLASEPRDAGLGRCASVAASLRRSEAKVLTRLVRMCHAGTLFPATL